MSLGFFTGLVLSAAIGLSLGLIGGGGSILTVPILVYFIGIDAHEAVGMSLAVVGVTSIFGAYLHYRRGNVEPRGGLVFGLSGIAGAFLGSPLTRMVSPSVLMLLFAALMFVVAVLMIRRRQHTMGEEAHEPEYAKSIAAGFGVGVLTGFLGVGGGFLIVPALVFFGGMPMKKAVGTSLLIIAMNCVAGFLGHLSQELFDVKLALLISTLALCGAIFGTVLSHRFSVLSLQRSFAYLVLAVAAVLTYNNITGLF